MTPLNINQMTRWVNTKVPQETLEKEYVMLKWEFNRCEMRCDDGDKKSQRAQVSFLNHGLQFASP